MNGFRGKGARNRTRQSVGSRGDRAGNEGTAETASNAFRAIAGLVIGSLRHGGEGRTRVAFGQSK